MNTLNISNIELFFKDPKAPHPEPNPPQEYGVLHLLRRDIIKCSGKDPETGKKASVSALWPQTMAVLAGIDLLGKFYYGSDNRNCGAVGKRFRGFIEKYFTDISPAETLIIWHLRNSLLHSFGLYSEGAKGKVYIFRVTNTEGKLISDGKDNHYTVDLLKLNSLFEEAVEKYKEDLLKDSCLQDKFNIMFKNYGWVLIGHI